MATVDSSPAARTQAAPRPTLVEARSRKEVSTTAATRTAATTTSTEPTIAAPVPAARTER